MNLAGLVCRLLLAASFCLAATRASPAEIMVFGAASLTESLKEIAAGYEKESGDRIFLNLEASSTLARQIEQGAPADIFFSADEAKMDAVERQGWLVEGTRRSLLSNTLVIVVPAKQGAWIRSAEELAGPGIKRLALGDPKAVPIGVYARQYLEGRGLWAAIAPKVITTENVRAALAAVESGEADASIVYKTDALISKKVRVAFEVPAREGPTISYSVALLKGGKNAAAAQKFLQFLGAEKSAAVFEKHGFIWRGRSAAQ